MSIEVELIDFMETRQGPEPASIPEFGEDAIEELCKVADLYGRVLMGDSVSLEMSELSEEAKDKVRRSQEELERLKDYLRKFIKSPEKFRKMVRKIDEADAVFRVRLRDDDDPALTYEPGSTQLQISLTAQAIKDPVLQDEVLASLGLSSTSQYGRKTNSAETAYLRYQENPKDGDVTSRDVPTSMIMINLTKLVRDTETSGLRATGESGIQVYYTKAGKFFGFGLVFIGTKAHRSEALNISEMVTADNYKKIGRYIFKEAGYVAQQPVRR